MRNVAVTVLFLSLSTAAIAQETFFSEAIEVRITNVDVVVTGRDGKPVTGLTKDDFELYEDGIRKDISNFAEVRGGPLASLTPGAQPAPGTAPAATTPQQDTRRRDITIFIDNAVLHPLRRNEIVPELRRFLDTAVRPGDTVGIVTWSRSLKLELEPTSDRTAVDAAVKRITSQTTNSSSLTTAKEHFYQQIALLIRAYAERVTFPNSTPPKPPWSLAIAEASAYGQQAVHESRQRVEALKSVVAWRRGVEGRKILVLLTTEITTNPAEWAFNYLEANRQSFEGDIGLGNTPASTAFMEAKRFEIPGLVQEITSVANSAGVTLYPIDATGKTANLEQKDASTMVPFSATGGVPVTASLMPTLQPIASETGGVALSGSDNWRLAFDTISNDLDTYYSLGYRSSGAREDRVKRIEVKLKNKRLTVRTRGGIIEKSVTSEMNDAVAANLFHPSAKNDLAIKVSTGAKTAGEEESVVVPITVVIPMDKLTLVPEGADLTGRFALYAAFLRNDGAVSKVTQQPQAFRFPASSLKNRKELKVTLDVKADNRTNVLSVGVMDEMSKTTGFASAKLE